MPSYIALDLNYISEDRFQTIHDMTNQLERQINSLIAYLAQNRQKTIKEASAPYLLDLPEDN